MSTILKNLIINEIDSISYDTNSPQSVMIDQSVGAIAKAIRSYLTSYSVFVGTTLGSVASVPPAAFSASLTIDYLSLGSESSLKTLLLGVGTGVSTLGTYRMFQAISTWLTVPPTTLQVVSMVPPLTTFSPFSGIVSFPAIATNGLLCESELALTSWSEDMDEVKDKYWEIFSKYLASGLNSNVIPPTPMVGTLGAFPYVGTNTVLLTFG